MGPLCVGGLIEVIPLGLADIAPEAEKCIFPWQGSNMARHARHHCF